MPKKIQIPKCYEPLFLPKRYKALSGGRGSAKSESVARALVILGSKQKEFILCTRELQNSIEDSVHKTIKTVIEEHELPHFRIYNSYIENYQTGTEFIFKGIRHNVQEIKSTKGVTKCWVEEAHSITKDSLDILLPTIREPNSEIWFTYNRLMVLDPVHAMFGIKPRSDTFYLHTTFRDNIFFPDVLEAERLYCLSQSSSDYDHIWEGEPKASAGNIYDTEWFIFTSEIPIENDYDYRFIVADTAYKEKQLTKKEKANDPDFQAFYYCGVKNKKLYIIDIIFKQLRAVDVEGWCVPWIQPKVNWGFRYCWVEDKGHGIYLNQRFPQIRIPIPPQEMLEDFMKSRRLDKVERAQNSVARIDRINKNVIINTGMGEDKIKRLKDQLTFFPNVPHDDLADCMTDAIQIALDKPDYVSEYKRLLGRE